MKLRFVAQGIELTAELEDYVRRRIHFALGRFAGKIKCVSVRLADLNGPRGCVDKSCELRVDAGLRQEVIVGERHHNIHAAVAFAAERVDRAVQRQLESANKQRYGDRVEG